MVFTGSEYTDDLDLFVVHLKAHARDNSTTGGASDWADWAVDCSNPGTPVVTAYVAPWLTPRLETEGALNK